MHKRKQTENQLAYCTHSVFSHSQLLFFFFFNEHAVPLGLGNHATSYIRIRRRWSFIKKKTVDIHSDAKQTDDFIRGVAEKKKKNESSEGMEQMKQSLNNYLLFDFAKWFSAC